MMNLKRNLLLFSLICACASLGSRAQEPDIRRDATVNAIEEVMPSVANIATKSTEPVRDPFERLRRQMWGQQPYDEFLSIGSGVVIDENGYLLTNDHVIHGANEIQVRFGTGTNQYDAVVVKTDPKTDVALLKLKAKPGEKFHAIKMAKEDDLLLGETVLALGNPLGLGGSVSRGILSSKSRTVPRPNDQLPDLNCLQTDAAINPGNSGGPLVDLRGELIGINVQVAQNPVNGQQAQGIGFAIPVREIEKALSEIFPTEFVKSYWFGARVKVGSYPLIITSVQAESPAGSAGLKVGDVVMQVNGKVPKTFIDFGQLLASNAPSDIPITYRRGNETKDISLRLVPASSVFNAAMVRQKLGLTLEKTSDGFVITKVAADSPASAAGLAPQTLIWAVDRQAPPDDVTAFAKLLYAKNKDEPVLLHTMTIEKHEDFNVVRRNVVQVTPR